MKRIAFYLPSFDGGGAERNTALIAAEMARAGQQVLIIVDNLRGPNLKLLPPEVRVRQLKGNNFSRPFHLARLLRQEGTDYLFARLGLCPLIGVLSKVITGSRPKLIISYHNPYDPKTHFGVRVTWWSVALLSRVANHTFGVSRDVSNELIARYGAQRSKTMTVNNPVDLTWVEEASKEPLPENFRHPGRFVLSVGRLVPQKGYPDLIHAYAGIAHQTDADLVIVGQGPLEANLRALLAELGLQSRVHLAGYFANPFPIYNKAEIFVLASHWEGFGNVVVEALACGKKVVVTDCAGGPKEILDHGTYGQVVPVGDTRKLGEAMLVALAAEPDPRTAQERANTFALPRITKQYLELCD